MIAAIHAIIQESMKVSSASTVFQVPEATLRRYVKKN